jgi:hypothetical protein
MDRRRQIHWPRKSPRRRSVRRTGWLCFPLAEFEGHAAFEWQLDETNLRRLAYAIEDRACNVRGPLTASAFRLQQLM